MKKFKRAWKRQSAFVLAMLLSLTMAFPVNSYAANEITEPDTQVEEMQEISEASEEKTEEAKVLPRAYDTDKPVIEEITVPQNGQTLKDGDSLEIRVKAYDLGVGITDIQVQFYAEEEGGSTDWNRIYFDKFEKIGEKEYVGKYPLSNVGDCKVYFTIATVTDGNGNYVSQRVTDNSVQLEAVQKSVKVTDFQFPNNGKTFDVSETSTIYDEMTLHTESVLPERSITLQFANETGSTWHLGAYAEEGSSQFIFNSSSEPQEKNGTWILKRAYQDRFGKALELEIANMEQYSFRITGQTEEEVETEDKEAPVIESVELENNGGIAKAGDKFEIKVKAKDNVALDTDSGYLYMHASMDIADSDEYVSLTYNEEDGLYHGTFEVTEETYPCEWYIDDIRIWDMADNEANDNKVLSGYPYYVNVHSGENDFAIPTYNVTLAFTALDERGNETYESQEVKNVPHRATLKEAGITFPKAESKYPGLVQTGWVDYDGNEITEDTVIVDSTYMSVYASYDKVLVRTYYNYLDEQGALTKKGGLLDVPKGSTYGDLKKELPKKAPETPAYKGLQLQGWEMISSYDDTEIISGMKTNASFNAVYDKKIVMASCWYPSEDGMQGYLQQGISLEKNEGYEDALKKVQSEIRPSDMSKEYEFEKWEEAYVREDDVALENFEGIRFNAKYKGKKFIFVDKRYYDKEGWYTVSREPSSDVNARITQFVEENATYEAVKELLNKEKLPEMYPGLKFKEWYFSSSEEDFAKEVPNGGKPFSLRAKYNNCLVRYLLDTNKDDEPDSIICVVANNGDTLTFPKELEGYGTIEWGEWIGMKPGDTFKVEEDMTFWGTAVKKPVDPEQPTEPDKPVDPEQPTEPDKPVDPEKPTEPAKPEGGTKLPDAIVNEVVKDLNNMAAGEKHSPIKIKMDDATVISKEILEAAKGKDVDIQLDMGGYTWTINGKDIAGSNLKDINLEVKRNTNAIPNKVIKQLAGDNPVEQLSLTHNGDFGFKASLTINVGSQYAGKYGNLFYYDSDGKMVFMNAGKINPDGTVSLDFSHASEYLVPITDEPMDQGDVPPALQPGEDDGIPQTGDTLPVMPTVVMLFAAAAVIAVYGVKLKKNR